MDVKWAILFVLHGYIFKSLATNHVWYYECKEGYCLKTEITPQTIQPLSLAECNILYLEASGIWPKPTGRISVANLTEININNIFLHTESNTSVTNLVKKGFDIFKSQLKEVFKVDFSAAKGASVNIHVNIKNKNLTRLLLDTNESYKLTVIPGVSIGIKADTYFGMRNALETLSQLIVYDDIRNRILVPANVSIEDKPVYSWRGVMLDTARNYMPVETIKNTLKAMSASKLNTFHWHLTDSQSFPYVSKSRPEISRYGAYSSKKVYDDETIKSIVEYGRVRGIRVVPEFDAPAHVGEGWQKTGVVTCFNFHPWQSYCAEPPCGQFDPSIPKLYDILEDIYGDMLDQFGTEVFHMGGDEVNFNCWNNTENLKNWMISKGWSLNKEGFENVWTYFQDQAVQRLYKRAGKQIPVILWTSDLTSLANVTKVLPNDKYFLQVWDSYFSKVDDLLENNYSLILSYYNNLYLDCGFSKFTNDDTNWCSPYKTWQQIYENKPIYVAGNKKNQILGGETALWTETAGSGSVDSKIWPRAAALAEALWTEPSTLWNDAEERMHVHTERLVSLGINADALIPEWCLQNQQNCPEFGKFN